MVARLISVLMLMALAAGCAPQPVVQAGGAPALLIQGATLIPMTADGRTLPNHDVLVQGERIVAVGPRGRVRAPGNTRIVDGRGRFLMPALADMHVHLEYVEDPAVLSLFVQNGVATVRSMDGRPFILDWRNRVWQGSLVGPRIVTAGPIIDGSPPLRDDNLAVADAAAAQAAVRRQAQQGYDFIKLYTNLGGEPYAAAVAEARQLGLRVAGHVPRTVPLDTALAAQWSLEHLGDLAGAVMGTANPPPAWARRALAGTIDPAKLQSLAMRLAAARIWVVPTLVQQDRSFAPAAEVDRWLAEPSIRSLPPSVLDQWRGAVGRFTGRMDADDWAMIEQARRNRLATVAALHRAGVRIALGTDTPNPFVAMGASVHIELQNMVAAGLSPFEALRTATVAPAEMLGLEREQGTIEPGRRADLLLLARNPLEDIGATRDIVGLVLAGRWLSPADLSALPLPRF